MSSDYYGGIAGEMADQRRAAERTWPCCEEHCDHDPGALHWWPCIACEYDLPDDDRH